MNRQERKKIIVRSISLRQLHVTLRNLKKCDLRFINMKHLQCSS